MQNRLRLCLASVLGLLLAASLTSLLARVSFAEPAAPTAIYTVNYASSDVVLTGCSGVGTCSLRGAVQLANASAQNVLINFAQSLNGVTITLSSTLMITGGDISIGGTGPNLTLIHAPPDLPAFKIASNNNIIDDLSIFGHGWENWNTGQDGILIQSGSNNLIDHFAGIGLGRAVVYIGPAASGNRIQNSWLGVRSFASDSRISCGLIPGALGAAIYGANNLITSSVVGCNIGDGILMAESTALSNTLVGNYIGVSPLGDRIGNATGVALETGAHHNRIGVAGLAQNIISANGEGVHIQYADTSHNTVVNNYIGLSPSGTYSVGNLYEGVWISDGADSNVVGGYWYTERNVIGGNWRGVRITGNGLDYAAETRYNLIAGNWIGLNATRDAAVPNQQEGILIDSGAWANVIGGSVFDGNIMAGNGGDGLTILGSNSNTVWDNFFGQYITVGVFISNGGNGIRLDRGATYNGIRNNLADHAGKSGIVISGSTSLSNSLSNNLVLSSRAFGIALLNGTHDNLLDSNDTYDNALDGILLDGAGTTNNVITGALTYNNLGGAGIHERNGATNNVWTQLSTYGNGGLGIDKDPAGPSGSFPAILSVSVNAGNVTVSGVASPAILQTVKVELYRVDADPSGFGEGEQFLGATNADLSGNWSLTFAGTKGCYTAFQTITGGFTGSRASSEFGPNTCRTFLPLVVR